MMHFQSSMKRKRLQAQRKVIIFRKDSIIVNALELKRFLSTALSNY